MSKRLHGYVPVKLLDGAWRYVHAMVDPQPSNRGIDRRFFKATVDLVPGMSRYKSRSRVFWEKYILAKMPAGSLNADGYDVYELGDPGVVHLFRAIEEPCVEGLWWSSPRGALERPATVYEIMRREEDVPPREGWVLVDGGVLAAALKAPGQRAMSSELEDDERRQKRASIEAKVDKARRSLARHSRGLALKKTLVAQWQKKLSKLEKRLAFIDEVERETYKGERR